MASNRRLSVRQYLVSILGAAFGVQSEAVRRRDVAQGSPAVFILGGLAFVALFVLILVAIVKLVLASA